MSSKPALGPADYQRAAAALGVDVATIRAVAEVESRGRGFGPDGQPVILFERHVFDRRTSGRFRSKVPDLSHPTPGGYGPSSMQHSRLQRAADLDRDAALQSASWGLFQIMGFNHRAAGHPTLQGFINAMYRGEGDQLDAVISFIKAHGSMVAALRAKDWATFARLYNGPAYAKNKYDTKLAAAYAKYTRPVP